MGLRQILEMPTIESHKVLIERRLRSRLGSNRGAILFLLQEEKNRDLYQQLASHVYENLEENSIHLQRIQEDNGQEYILANPLSPAAEIEDSPEPIIISTDNNLEGSYVVSPITYRNLSELCFDPEVERYNIKMQLEDAI